jgi:hypothetical protein
LRATLRDQGYLRAGDHEARLHGMKINARNNARRVIITCRALLIPFHAILRYGSLIAESHRQFRTGGTFLHE